MKRLYLIFMIISLINILVTKETVCKELDSLAIVNIKYNIYSITDRIWKTLDPGITKPGFIFTNMEIDTNKIISLACYDPNNDSIYFNLKFYEFCIAVSEDALAGVLAHEFGHFCNHHQRNYSLNGIFMSNSEKQFINEKIDIKSLEISKEHETQADVFSAFHCLSTGYNISKAMPDLLEKIYSLKKAEEPSEYYLTLNERMKIFEEAYQTVLDLIPLFKLANKLCIIGVYELAGECFDYIENKGNYKSSEIYRNVGISYALGALEYMNPDKKKFIYPFELSSNMKIVQQSSDYAAKGTGEDRCDNILRELMLEKAEKRFSTLQTINPIDVYSYLNLACIDELLGNIEGARNYAIEAEKHAFDKHTKQLACVAKGIIYANLNYVDAKYEFEAAEDLSIAKYNLRILNKSPVDSLYTKVFEIARHLNEEEENINTISSTNYKDFMIGAKNYSYKIERIDRSVLDAQVKELSKPDYYYIMLESGGNTTFFIETNVNYRGKSARGIIIGSSLQEINDKYGHPARIIPTNNGDYFLFKTLNIAFRIKDKKVAGWMIYD